MGAENLIPVALVAGLLELTWKQKEGSFPGDFSEFSRSNTSLPSDTSCLTSL
jgi:hypothetical protein